MNNQSWPSDAFNSYLLIYANLTMKNIYVHISCTYWKRNITTNAINATLLQRPCQFKFWQLSWNCMIPVNCCSVTFVLTTFPGFTGFLLGSNIVPVVYVCLQLMALNKINGLKIRLHKTWSVDWHTYIIGLLRIK